MALTGCIQKVIAEAAVDAEPPDFVEPVTVAAEALRFSRNNLSCSRFAITVDGDRVSGNVCPFLGKLTGVAGVGMPNAPIP